MYFFVKYKNFVSLKDFKLNLRYDYKMIIINKLVSNKYSKLSIRI